MSVNKKSRGFKYIFAYILGCCNVWMATICVDVLQNSYTLWIKFAIGQLHLMAQWFTMYGCHGLMVYNVWISWINGLQRLDNMTWINLWIVYVPLWLYGCL